MRAGRDSVSPLSARGTAAVEQQHGVEGSGGRQDGDGRRGARRSRGSQDDEVRSGWARGSGDTASAGVGDVMASRALCSS